MSELRHPALLSHPAILVCWVWLFEKNFLALQLVLLLFHFQLQVIILCS